MPALPPTAALRVRDLRKTFKDVVAVDGLELEVRAGECFGLLGPNGAGKTTTIEICEGLTEPDSGEVEILGMRWDTHSAELRQRLGIQLQETQLADKVTVLETIRLFRSFFRRGPMPFEVIALVQLEEKINARYHGFTRLPDGSITAFDAAGAGSASNQGTYLIAINGKGETVGGYVDASNGRHSFVLHKNGDVTSIELPGVAYTAATAINEEGEVAGYSSDGSGFIWNP